MTRQAVNRWWRQCAGCGRERRLVRSGTAVCDHNRWDPAAKAMVRCEGGGREPAPHSAPASAGEHSHAPEVPGLVRGAV
jgi:hypothetical protein